jgi:hypothetical protein
VRERETDSGLVRFEVQVTPEEAAVVRKALELAMSRAWRGEKAATSDVSAENAVRREQPPAAREQPPIRREHSPLRREQPPVSREYPASLQRADAFVAMAESYLASPAEGQRGGPPVEIVVHVDAGDVAGEDADAPETTAAPEDGPSLPRATFERLACDSAVVRLVEDSRGNALDVGRRRRTIPGALRRALRLRDRGCRFPGCTDRWVDGHHVVPWSRGGETKLANLASLCRRHHRFVHELGFRIEADGAGGFAFIRPSGLRVEAARTAPPIGAAPVAALCERHRAEGIEIDARTGFPRWDGTPVDYDHIVLCLMSRHESAAGHAGAA